MILTEASPICAEGHGYPRTPGIHTPEQIAGWKRVTEAVHGAAGKIALQLWHVGRISHPDLQPGGMLLANPDLVERFRRGAPLNPPDYTTFYMGEEKGYTDYPFLPG